MSPLFTDIFMILLFIFPRSESTLSYRFEVEKVTTAEIPEYPCKPEGRKASYLSELEIEERDNLCIAAKNFTEFQFDTQRTQVFDPHDSGAPVCLWIAYADFTGIYREAIHCATDPQLILRIGDTEEQVIIMKLEAFEPPPMPGNINNFEFEIESTGYLDVMHMYSYGDFPNYKENAIVKLEEEGRVNLCEKVKEFASLDGFNRKTEMVYSWPSKLEFPEEVPGKGRSMWYIGICCRTIPKAWLRMADDSNQKIKIMIQDYNKYSKNGHYTFEIRTVKYYQVRLEREWSDYMDGYLDWKFIESQRLLICFFAKKLVKEEMLISKEPKLDSPKTGKPGHYKIKLPDRVEEHVAFSCPSYPTMYAYFDKLVEKHIVVLFVN